MNGITGIEDRLQDEVSDTIMKMTEAKPKAVFEEVSKLQGRYESVDAHG